MLKGTKWLLPMLVAWPFGYALAGVAEIVALSGKGEFRRESAAAWNEAKIKQALDAGNFVRTGDFSSMALLFSDKTQVRLSQNSMFQIKGVDAKSGDTTINLRQGRAWTQAKSVGERAAVDSKTPVSSLRPTDATIQPSIRAGRLLMETPSAIGAIHGTDWEMEVDAEGRARITVLHGEVEFYNEHGRVFVRANEQALAEKGKAPVKMLLQNPAERVQWVTSYTVDYRRYAELREIADTGDEAAVLRSVRQALQEQRLPQAHRLAQDLAHRPGLTTGVAHLLLSDFAVVDGDLAGAARTLEEGRRRFGSDPRLDAQLARIALLRDDAKSARQLVASALARHPDASELRLVEGELARFDGNAKLAAAAYRAAIVASPREARAWHGLGVVENEKEDARRARPLLEKALVLDADLPGARGELATLETFANNLGLARQHYERALQAQADDYVALTGLGLLQLKAGETEHALATLLRANVIEPRYARAVVYMGVAYHQLGRHSVALETLARASELDPRDPLPHQLASLIHTDLVQPGKAIDEAREALRLMPYLKSLNQVANNQKGSANLGYALSQFGLENWALSYAQQSYDPFWAGSHLFLADRYIDGYAKQSELVQGYLTDPTSFGASNRFNDLVPRPGRYVTVSGLATRSAAEVVTVPSVVVNGYGVDVFPIAYFVQVDRINQIPRQVNDDGWNNRVSAALGMRPREDLALFLQVNSTHASYMARSEPEMAQQTTARQTGLELGGAYRFGPAAQTWLKLSITDGDGLLRGDDNRWNGRIAAVSVPQIRQSAWQARHTWRTDGNEWTVGFEAARSKEHVGDSIGIGRGAPTRVGADRYDDDRSTLLYAGGRVRATDVLLIDAGLFRHGYRINLNALSSTEYPSGGSESWAGRDRYSRQIVAPRIGLVYTPAAGEVWRLAYQKWLRPVSSNGLAPVSTAGIVIDDEMVLPDGELRRWRLQFEKELSEATFASLFIEDKHVRNFGQLGQVRLPAGSVNELQRFRNLVSRVFQIHSEGLEGASIFLSGRMRSAGAAINRRLGEHFAGTISYLYRDADNTADNAFLRNKRLPFVPRNQLSAGLAWDGPDRWLVQTAAVYRSGRYSDEANQKRLLPGWNLTLKANWQSADKRWLVEAYALDLLKKQTAPTLGVNLAWRY